MQNDGQYETIYPKTNSDLVNYQEQTLTEKIQEIDQNLNSLTPNKTFSVGDILYTARKDLDDNWLKCDGKAFSQNQYPNLAAILPYNWGNLYENEKAISYCYNSNFKKIYDGENKGFIFSELSSIGQYCQYGKDLGKGPESFSKITFSNYSPVSIEYYNGYYIFLGEDYTRSDYRSKAKIFYSTSLTGSKTELLLNNSAQRDNSKNGTSFITSQYIVYFRSDCNQGQFRQLCYAPLSGWQNEGSWKFYSWGGNNEQWKGACTLNDYIYVTGAVTYGTLSRKIKKIQLNNSPTSSEKTINQFPTAPFCSSNTKHNQICVSSDNKIEIYDPDLNYILGNSVPSGYSIQSINSLVDGFSLVFLNTSTKKISLVYWDGISKKFYQKLDFTTIDNFYGNNPIYTITGEYQQDQLQYESFMYSLNPQYQSYQFNSIYSIPVIYGPVTPNISNTIPNTNYYIKGK